MTRMVNIIIDASGSMGDDEKNNIIEYIFPNVKNMLKDYINIFSWNNEIKKVEKLKDISYIGKTNIKELLSFVESNNEEYNLIFSDFNYSSSEFKRIYNDKVFYIGIGFDRKKLEKNYFEAYDILNLINWIKREIENEV